MRAWVGDLTLAEFSEWWWRVHVLADLQPSTRIRYRQVLNSHVLSRLGQLRLREITPWVVLEFRAELSEAGVGRPTARKALFILQAIMRLAVLRGAVDHNPVEAVRKPQRQFRSVTPLPPSAIEAIRRHLSPTDATLVSLLAYAGAHHVVVAHLVPRDRMCHLVLSTVVITWPASRPDELVASPLRFLPRCDEYDPMQLSPARGGGQLQRSSGG